jgi:hypothetical protein
MLQLIAGMEVGVHEYIEVKLARIDAKLADTCSSFWDPCVLDLAYPRFRFLS